VAFKHPAGTGWPPEPWYDNGMAMVLADSALDPQLKLALVGVLLALAAMAMIAFVLVSRHMRRRLDSEIDTLERDEPEEWSDAWSESARRLQPADNDDDLEDDDRIADAPP